MSETNKTILIVGGIAVAGFLAYKLIMRGNVQRSGTGSSTASGSGAGGSGASGGDWWSNLGSWGSTLGGAIGGFEHIYSGLSGGTGGTGG
jgi:hypothetical protein